MMSRSSYRPRPVTLETMAITRGIIESPASSHPLVERLRITLAQRGTDGSGFADLCRRFSVLDRDGSKSLNLEEFKIAFQRCNLSFSEQEISTLFYFFDNYEKNHVDYDEFMLGIRGPIGMFRRELIDKAWQQIDINGDGFVPPEEVIDRFDPSQHPDVKSGVKKAQQVFRDFVRCFEVGGEVEGKITRNEFDVYYFNVSASIDRDDYFEAVIRSAWHVSTVASGEGWNPRRQVALRDVRDSRDREREVAPDDFDDEFAVSQQYEVERGRHGPASQGRGGSYSRGGGSGGAGGSYGAGSAPSYGPSSSSGYGPRSSRGRSTSPSATRSSSSPRPLSPGGVGGPSSNRPIVY